MECNPRHQSLAFPGTSLRPCAEFFHYNNPPTRNEYNPVLQRFPDEVDTGKDIMNEMDDYDRRMEKMRLHIEHQEVRRKG